MSLDARGVVNCVAQAMVDVFPTDLALRGVYVAWGDHTITFDYQPRRVYAGMLINALSVIAIGIAVFVKRWVRG